MSPRRLPIAAVAASCVAFALTLLYAALVQPQWEPQLNDQQQYLALARGLVDRGEFTRAVGAEAFIPETIRLPGYPLLIATTCIGGCDHWRVAVLQGLLYATLVLAAWALLRRARPRYADAAAFAVALYLPYAYYASLALSDLAAAALVALAVLAWVTGHDTRRARWMFVAGTLLGWAALMRASLLLLPVGLAVLALQRRRDLPMLAVACVVGAAAVVAPYVAYSQLNFGRPIAGNGGAVLWIGALQFRSEPSLDALERQHVDAVRSEIAAFDAEPDRRQRALDWLRLDADLSAHARAVIAHDPVGWIVRAVPRSIELWAGDVPVPGGAAGDVAAMLVAAQLAVFVVGVAGVLRLVRRGSLIGVLAAVVIAYVWVTAVPFQTEGRYALPARLFILIGFVTFFQHRWPRPARARGA